MAAQTVSGYRDANVDKSTVARSSCLSCIHAWLITYITDEIYARAY